MLCEYSLGVEGLLLWRSAASKGDLPACKPEQPDKGAGGQQAGDAAFDKRLSGFKVFYV